MKNSMIAKHIFGRTGHASTRLIFGGYALSNASQDEADRALELLLQHGINHIDVARLYGEAEKRIGPWMENHRRDFFLATKTRKRGYQDAWEDLQISLNTLRVDQIDLWQLHGLTNPGGWAKAMGPEGALQAMLEARQKGYVHFLGVTGHGTPAPKMHKQSLESFDFDSVLLPYSYWQMQQKHYGADFEALVGMCQSRNVAVQTIKSLARRPWGDQPKTHNTYFYEPLTEQAAIDQSVAWVLGDPRVFLITAGDLTLLPKMLQAAERFSERPSDADMQRLVAEFGIQPVFT
jgi:aryl-alcohol dehydrogenase-like predicted oxidoreductase